MGESLQVGAPVGVDVEEAVELLQPLEEATLEEAGGTLAAVGASGGVPSERAANGRRRVLLARPRQPRWTRQARLPVRQGPGPRVSPLRVEATLGEEAALKLNQPGDATLDMNHLATPLRVEAAVGEEAALKMSRRVKGGQTLARPPWFYLAPEFCATQCSEPPMPETGGVQLAIAANVQFLSAEIRVMHLAISVCLVRCLQKSRCKSNLSLVRPTKSPRHHDRRRSSG